MNESLEKIVYFVRHGQSDGNTLPVYQPLDSPLTDLGKVQAKQIAERVAKLSVAALIVSPLVRAKETGEVISRITGRQSEYINLFGERAKPKRLDGQSHDNEGMKKLWDDWERSLYTSGTRVEDGENYDDIIARADAALKYLEQRKETQIVVVTHGFFLRTIVARVILGGSLTPAAFRYFQLRTSTANTSLSALKYVKIEAGLGWRLWIYNDHAHLG